MKIFSALALTAFALSSVSAHATTHLADYGIFSIDVLDDYSTCSMSAETQKAGIGILYDATRNKLTIITGNKDVPFTQDADYKINIKVDDEDYQWDGKGIAGGTVTAVAMDAGDAENAAEILVNATKITFTEFYSETPISSLLSDSDFEDALKAIVLCSITLNEDVTSEAPDKNTT